MSSQPAPQPKSKLPGDDRNVVPAGSGEVALTFEERVQLFWHENRKTVLLTCLAMLAVFVGKELVVIYLRHREEAVAAGFDAAGKDPAKLRGFADANPDFGLAWLALADESLKAGNHADAKTNYEKAAAKLAGSPFSGRAQLGLAVSHALAGDKAKAEELLKKLAGNLKELRGSRAEANLHLAILAREAGRFDEARTLLAGIFLLDRQQALGNRVMAEMASLPPEKESAAPAEATPAPELKLSMPGKP